MGCMQSKEESEKLIAGKCTGNREQLKEQGENQACQVTLLMLGMLELILILMLKTFFGHCPRSCLSLVLPDGKFNSNTFLNQPSSTHSTAWLPLPSMHKTTKIYKPLNS